MSHLEAEAAVAALAKVFPVAEADDRLRKRTQLEHDREDGITAAQNQSQALSDRDGDYELYAATTAVALVSNVVRAADARAEAARLQLEHMQDRSLREGRPIDPDSLAFVRRGVYRNAAVASAVGEAIAFLSARASRLRRAMNQE